MLNFCPGKERDAGLGDAGDTSDAVSVGQGSRRCRRAAGMARWLQAEHGWCEPWPRAQQRLRVASVKRPVGPSAAGSADGAHSGAVRGAGEEDATGEGSRGGSHLVRLWPESPEPLGFLWFLFSNTDI